MMEIAKPPRLSTDAAADLARVLADLNTSAIRRGAAPGWSVADQTHDDQLPSSDPPTDGDQEGERV